MHIHINIINYNGITPTEGTILRQMCAGDSRKEISKALGRSQSTINRHIENLYQKFNVNNPAKLIVTAIAKGIIAISISNLFRRFYFG